MYNLQLTEIDLWTMYIHSQVLHILPAVVHQHIVDTTADVIFSLFDLFQYQQSFSLQGPLLLVDPLLQTLLLL